jgi:predicted Zn-dependent protease
MSWLSYSQIVPGAEIPLDLIQQTTLHAGDRLEAEGVLRVESSSRLQREAYTLTTTIGAAVAGFRGLDGAQPWRARFVPSGEIVLRFVPPTGRADLRRALELEADNALAQGAPERSLEIYTKMLAEVPGDMGARFGVARAAVELGRYGEAAAQLEALIPHVQNRPVVRMMLARAYVGAGQVEKAELTLRQDFTPKEVAAHIRRFLEEARRRGR